MPRSQVMIVTLVCGPFAGSAGEKSDGKWTRSFQVMFTFWNLVCKHKLRLTLLTPQIKQLNLNVLQCII